MLIAKCVSNLNTNFLVERSLDEAGARILKLQRAKIHTFLKSRSTSCCPMITIESPADCENKTITAKNCEGDFTKKGKEKRKAAPIFMQRNGFPFAGDTLIF